MFIPKFLHFLSTLAYFNLLFLFLFIYTHVYLFGIGCVAKTNTVVKMVDYFHFHCHFAYRAVTTFFHWGLLFAVLIHCVSNSSLNSWDHLNLGRPLFLLPCRTSHTVMAYAHLSWRILATCPAHCHLILFALVATSSRPLFLRSTSFFTLSFRLMFRIFLSIFRWHVCSIKVCFFVSAHVWQPYSYLKLFNSLIDSKIISTLLF